MPPHAPADGRADRTSKRGTIRFELESFATSSAVGFAEMHPFITLTTLVVVVVLLLSAGAVFTLAELGNALTPAQPVIWFIAWMSGFGPPWRT